MVKIDSIKEHFDYRSREVDPGYFSSISNSQKYEFDLIKNSIGSVAKGGTALDVGGGWGRVSLFLLQEGFSVSVLDVSSDALKVLKDIYLREKNDNWGKLNILEMDFMKYNCDQPYDIVLFVGILHHVDSISATLSKAYQQLKKGGMVFILEPNPLNILWYIFFYFKGNWKYERGIFNCHKNNIMKCLNNSDFSSIKDTGYGFLPNSIFNISKDLLKFNAAIISNLPFFRKFSLFNVFTAVKP